MTHPETPGHEDSASAPDARPEAPAHSFAALGEGSIHLFILFAGLVLITPIGNLAPLAVMFGLMVFGFSVQLVLRMPHVVLPDLFRGALEGSAPGQWCLGQLDQNMETLQGYQRDPCHWMMAQPFDIFPRILLATGGLVTVISASVPGMAHVLGVVAILVSASILTRTLSVFFLGAALLSWSSVLPLVTN